MTLSMKPKTTAYDQKSRKSFFSFGFGSTKTLSSIRRKTTAMTGMSTPRFPAFWEDFRGSLPEPADSEHHFWVSAHRVEKLMIIRLWCKITCDRTFRTRRLFNFQTNVDKHFQDLWIKKGIDGIFWCKNGHIKTMFMLTHVLPWQGSHTWWTLRCFPRGWRRPRCSPERWPPPRNTADTCSSSRYRYHHPTTRHAHHGSFALKNNRLFEETKNTSYVAR